MEVKENMAELRVSLWAGKNFEARRIRFRRRGVAVRQCEALQFNNVLSSFTLRSGDNGRVTLVLFSRSEYQGSFRVYRGSQDVANLSRNDFNNRTSSFIFVGRNLTNDQIREIQRTRRAPRDIVEVRT